MALTRKDREDILLFLENVQDELLHWQKSLQRTSQGKKDLWRLLDAYALTSVDQVRLSKLLVFREKLEKLYLKHKALRNK